MRVHVQFPRLADWPERLADLVELRRAAPFVWGANDCATFAADAVLAITGVELLGVLRGAWQSEDEAAARLRRAGGLPAAVAFRLGRPQRGCTGAGRGAIVCAAIPTPTVGVLLSGWWCAPGAAGLVFRPAAEVRLAWDL